MRTSESGNNSKLSEKEERDFIAKTLEKFDDRG